MQFVFVSEHPPNLCPTANATTREMMKQGATELPALADKLGIKIVAINVFGPDHVIMGVVEADGIGPVRDFIMQSRMIQWSTTRVHATYTMEEALAKADELPAMF